MRRARTAGRRPLRVLVFPGGTESGLEIWRSLRWLPRIELFSAGEEVSSHAPYVFARHFVVPRVDRPGWLRRLNAVLRTQRIDYVFPAHDDVVLALAEHRRELRARVVGSPLATCRICRSKRATYRALRARVPVPQVLGPNDVRRFPVFAKPDRGQGSQDAHRIDDALQLAELLRTDPGRYLVTEYLPGSEYTVDCLTDRHGRLRYAAGRLRARIRNGISVDTYAVERPEFRRYARAINRTLRLRGAWFFQLKEDRDGRLRLLEVAPRIAGAMALNRVLGANLPLLSLYVAAGTDIEVLTNRTTVRMDRALTNRFRHDLVVRRAYVDLDDTLVVRGRVHDELVRLLHQFVGRGVRLILLTRHAGDPRAVLRHHRLDGLFDEVVHLEPGRPKSAAIRAGPGTILIDDSFSERAEVARRRRIPTFDASMLELLGDDRA